MKALLFFSLFFSYCVFAQKLKAPSDAKRSPEEFEKIKIEVVKSLESNLKMTKENLDCVRVVKNQAEMQKCFEKHRPKDTPKKLELGGKGPDFPKAEQK